MAALQELLTQYEKEVENLDFVIEKRKAEMGEPGTEAYARSQRILKLHLQQRSDLIMLCTWLKNYSPSSP